MADAPVRALDVRHPGRGRHAVALAVRRTAGREGKRGKNPPIGGNDCKIVHYFAVTHLRHGHRLVQGVSLKRDCRATGTEENNHKYPPPHGDFLQA